LCDLHLRDSSACKFVFYTMPQPIRIQESCCKFDVIIHQIFSLARDWSKHVTWPNIPLLKLGNIWEYSPIFKTARVAKKIWRIINTLASIWRENMLGYLSKRRTVFRERSSRETVRFEEQIMSADKYPSIFSRQMEAIVYVLHPTLPSWAAILFSPKFSNRRHFQFLSSIERRLNVTLSHVRAKIFTLISFWGQGKE